MRKLVSWWHYTASAFRALIFCFRVPELVPVVRMLNPPQTYSQHERQMNLAVPKFHNAAITPTVRQLQWHPVKDGNMEDVQVYKS